VTLDLPEGHHVVHGAMDWTRSRKIELNLAEGGIVAVEVSLPFAAAVAALISPKSAVRIKQVG